MTNHTKRTLLAVATVLFMNRPASAGDACTLPTGADASRFVSDETRQACIDAASIASEQPDLTTEDLVRGPIEPGEDGFGTVHCTFIPYIMELKSRGKSRKFWCYRTDSQGNFYNDRNEVPEGAIGVSESGVLIDARGRAVLDGDEQRQRPTILKVKYTNGGNRGREIYTEVAVSRVMWALGFPADRMFPAKVHCAGCSEDPFKDIRSKRDNRPADETNFFRDASIELRLATPIESKADQGWKWKEVYKESKWSAQTRTEFEAYVLALNLVHFHHGMSKQNTLGCTSIELDANRRSCTRPVLFVDDMGATFGGGSSRADLDKYRKNTVFTDKKTCELRADLAGFDSVSETARRYLAERLGRLSQEKVRAIFEVAGFNERTTEASVDAWTQSFMRRIAEVMTARCE